jgi:DNA-directed RNA polymerase subunit N (RpoN/RPB10)
MIEYIRCPTCANCIGEYYIAYIAMVDILNSTLPKEANASNPNYKFIGEVKFGEILNLLKLDRYCCRSRILCVSNFYETNL